MSYILDALKKSEQERNRGRTPDLRASHATPEAVSRPARWWPIALVVALVINAGVLMAWQPWEKPAASAPTVVIAAPATPKPHIEPPSLPAAPAPKSVAPQLAAQPVPASIPPMAESSPSPAKPVQSAEGPVQSLSELPPEIRRGIPEMSFAVHMYSPKAAERMVSINGKMMKEGQEVSPGLKLEQITADGMVFSYQGYRFKRGVF